MERKGKKRALELVKDLLIAALALSAVFLMGETQLFQLPEWLGGAALEESPAPSEHGWGQGSALRPANIALRGEMSRYGVQYDSQRIGELYAQITNPLSDALAGAGAPRMVTEKIWRDALGASRPSIYLDYRGMVPLAGLNAWLGGGRGENPALTGWARRLLLTENGSGNVQLYYMDDRNGGSYYVCDTTASVKERLEELVSNVPNNGVFSFEDVTKYGNLEPYTLICQEAPTPLVYHVSNPITLPAEGEELGRNPAVEGLLGALAFRSRSYNAYAVPDGVRIQEDGDQITITSGGTVRFQTTGKEEARYPLAAGSRQETWVQVDGAWAFTEQTLGSLCGDAWLYIMDVTEEAAGGVEVTFGYQLGGAPVQVGEDGWAAKVQVRDGAIVGFTFHVRQYTATDQVTLVLREYRAAAAMEALGERGKELTLYYRDAGGETVTAAWAAR